MLIQPTNALPVLTASDPAADLIRMWDDSAKAEKAILPDNLLQDYLPLAGGTMSGTLDMGLQLIDRVGQIIMNPFAELDMRAGTIDNIDKLFLATSGFPGIFQADGNHEVLLFEKRGSTPANYLQMANSDTGVNPYLTVLGDDAEITLELSGKGQGLGVRITPSLEVEISNSDQAALILDRDENLDMWIEFQDLGSARWRLGIDTITNLDKFYLYDTVADIDIFHVDSNIAQFNVDVDTDITGTLVVSSTITGSIPHGFVSTDEWVQSSSGQLQHRTSIELLAAIGAITAVVDDLTPQLGGMLDRNGFAIGDGTRKLLDFVEDGSAVNYFEIENEATGSGPIFRSVGTDTDVDFIIDPQAAGDILIGGSGQIRNSGSGIARLGSNAGGVGTHVTVNETSGVAEMQSSGVATQTLISAVGLGGTVKLINVDNTELLLLAQEIRMSSPAGMALIVEGPVEAEAFIETTAASSTAAEPSTINMRRADGTIASPTAVPSGFHLRADTAEGYDGTSYELGTEIRTVAEEAWDASGHGAGLQFFTTPNNTIVQQLVMQFDNQGELNVFFDMTASGTAGFEGLATFEGGVVVDSDIAVTGELSIAARMVHAGDTHTYFEFLPDAINLSTGATRAVEITNTNFHVNPDALAKSFTVSADLIVADGNLDRSSFGGVPISGSLGAFVHVQGSLDQVQLRVQGELVQSSFILLAEDFAQNQLLSVLPTGVIRFANAYDFPASDGVIGDRFISGGGGVLTFEKQIHFGTSAPASQDRVPWWVDSSDSTRYPTKVLTAGATVTVADDLVLCNTTSASFTVTLPPVADAMGKNLHFVKTGAANILTIKGDGTELIRGSNTVTISILHDSLHLRAGLLEWYTI